MVDIIVLRPPAGTFSRRRWSNGQGPRPVRSAAFLRVFRRLQKCAARVRTRPMRLWIGWLRRSRSRKVSEKISCWTILKTWGTSIRMGHGFCLQGDHVRYGALCQGDYGASSTKPSRMMTSMATVATLLEPGQPRWTIYGFYLGPLAKNVKSSSKINRQRIADVQDQANCGVAKHFDFSDGESDAVNTC